jgi:hypothetical protein
MTDGIKHAFIPLLILTVVSVGCMTALVWKWTNEIDRVLVPEHISLDTAKYKVLKEDSLTIQGMKIKRVYYLQKR